MVPRSTAQGRMRPMAFGNYRTIDLADCVDVADGSGPEAVNFGCHVFGPANVAHI
jgi:hypothetical protein